MTPSPFLPFAVPDIGADEVEAVREVIDSGWITSGPKVRLFEEEFARAVGAKHAIAVSSCTAALHLALEAAGVEPGDEVIVPTYTFAATAEVARYLGAHPVLVDVERTSLNVDPAAVVRAITPRTRAVIPVHIGGLPAAMDDVLAICRDRGIAVVDDAAHAFTAMSGSRAVGALGDMTCFSFYATKTITTGEGGMITTANDAWAERCRLMRLHGISRDALDRHASSQRWAYEILAPGFKYNLSDLAAAIGVVQLRKAEAMLARREAIAARYAEAFAGLDALEMPPRGDDCRHAWQLYVLRLHLDRLSIDRDRFIAELARRRIGASVHFIPLHVHPYYRETFGYVAADFPVAYAEYERALSLPIYSRMSDADVESVVAAVQSVVSDFSR